MVDESWLLADLPGYGYAKVSKKQRATWEIMIKTFLHRRPNLVLVFVLLDLRIEPMKSDIEFINWLGENQLPLALVFTKADKLKKQTELEHNLNIYKETLLLNWEQLPTYFITSSETGTGINELQTYIHSIVDAENEG